MKNNRSITRDFLFQALYSRSFLWTFNKEEFISSFFDEGFDDTIETIYFEELFENIIEKEWELASIISKFAPKFDVKTMPVINVIPVYIASYEMLYIKCDTIPVKASIDEAIELGKKYSDDQWRILINWVLNNLKTNLEEVKKELENLNTKEKIFFK